MDIAVPSRFACLKIEDDDFRPAKQKEPKKKPDKSTSSKKPASGDKKKIINKQQSSIGTKKEKPKKKQPSAKQWEEWKEKDDQIVNGTYEQDLQNAIMLSKLDYEERKETNKQLQKEAENEKKNNNKKKKNKAVSLEQFLSNNSETVKERNLNESGSEEVQKDEKFFERIQQDAQEELTKEKILQNRKKREANIEEHITVSQYQQKLELEMEKNTQLELELAQAKKEIAAVKGRNKKLCTILGHGEMKDKAAILWELERLTEVKNDLTDEVARLHGLLEQERSKVATLELQNKHKEKKNKKNGYAKV